MIRSTPDPTFPTPRVLGSPPAVTAQITCFARLPLWAQSVWVSPYFRGAISGIGLVNIYISFVEVFRLRRFS